MSNWQESIDQQVKAAWASVPIERSQTWNNRVKILRAEVERVLGKAFSDQCSYHCNEIWAWAAFKYEGYHFRIYFGGNGMNLDTTELCISTPQGSSVQRYDLMHDNTAELRLSILQHIGWYAWYRNEQWS